jgi:hypothetical protein
MFLHKLLVQRLFISNSDYLLRGRKCAKFFSSICFDKNQLAALIQQNKADDVLHLIKYAHDSKGHLSKKTKLIKGEIPNYFSKVFAGQKGEKELAIAVDALKCVNTVYQHSLYNGLVKMMKSFLDLDDCDNAVYCYKEIIKSNYILDIKTTEYLVSKLCEHMQLKPLKDILNRHEITYNIISNMCIPFIMSGYVKTFSKYLEKYFHTCSELPIQKILVLIPQILEARIRRSYSGEKLTKNELIGYNLLHSILTNIQHEIIDLFDDDEEDNNNNNKGSQYQKTSRDHSRCIAVITRYLEFSQEWSADIPPSIYLSIEEIQWIHQKIPLDQRFQYLPEHRSFTGNWNSIAENNNNNNNNTDDDVDNNNTSTNNNNSNRDQMMIINDLTSQLAKSSDCAAHCLYTASLFPEVLPVEIADATYSALEHLQLLERYLYETEIDHHGNEDDEEEEDGDDDFDDEDDDYFEVVDDDDDEDDEDGDDMEEEEQNGDTHVKGKKVLGIHSHTHSHQHQSNTAGHDHDEMIVDIIPIPLVPNGNDIIPNLANYEPKRWRLNDVSTSISTAFQRLKLDFEDDFFDNFNDYSYYMDHHPDDDDDDSGDATFHQTSSTATASSSVAPVPALDLSKSDP